MRITLSGFSWKMILSFLPPSVLRYQWVAITKFLVSPNLEVRKEAFDGFVESGCMFSNVVGLEIALEV